MMRNWQTLPRRNIQPVRKPLPDPPEGVRAVVFGQIAALLANTTIQLFVLWAAIDAFARHALAQVAGLAVFSGVLFLISLAVMWLGRVKEHSVKEHS